MTLTNFFPLNSVFQTFTFFDWLIIVVGLLFGPIPVYVLIRNYNRTKSLDYLVVAGVFTSWSLNLILGPFVTHFPGSNEDPLYRLFGSIVSFLFMMGIFFVFLHVVRFRWGWKEKPRLIWITGLLWVIIWILLFVPYHLWSLPFDPITLLVLQLLIGSETFRFSVGALFIYVYLSESLVLPTNRTLAVKRLLILVGLLAIVQGVLYDITLLFTYFTQNSNIWGIHSLIFYVTALIQGFTFTYIALRYPESMLISHAQVLRATEVYKKVLTIPAEIVDKDALLSYLKAIPPETFEI